MLFSIVFFCLLLTIDADCPPGGFVSQDRQFCYKFFGNGSGYYDANCESGNGYLMSIHNAFDNTFISARAREIMQTPSVQVRLGAKFTNGNWIWEDGTSFTYTNWASGQPDGKEQCLAISPITEKWYDTSCEENLPYFCEYPNNNKSISCDSLCDSGWTFFQPANACYKTFKDRMNWTSAESVCQTNNAHLASIHSDDENQFLAEFIRTGMVVPTENITYSYQVWIGLYSPYKNKTFQWSDNSTVEYLNWPPEQPFPGDDESRVAFVADHMVNETLFHTGNEYQKWYTKKSVALMRAFVCKKNIISVCMQ